MRTPPSTRQRCRATGNAVVEIALVLPLLLLLAIPIFDIARIIQANMILTNISREGANLASRTSETPQRIMDGIAATAPPLDFAGRGMLYVTKVMGNKEGGSIRNVIVQHDKWRGGGYVIDSSLLTCSSWNGGSCNLPSNPNAAPTANVLTNQLADGEVVYVVEGFYHANLMIGAINLGSGITTPQLGTNLHAMTIF